MLMGHHVQSRTDAVSCLNRVEDTVSSNVSDFFVHGGKLSNSILLVFGNVLTLSESVYHATDSKAPPNSNLVLEINCKQVKTTHAVFLKSSVQCHYDKKSVRKVNMAGVLAVQE
jgi:hypothetical protein